jgi:chemotaxis protein CheX
MSSFILPFVSSIKQATNEVLAGSIPEFSVVAKEVEVIKSSEISLSTGLFIIVGLTGKIKGRIIYRFDNISALKVASKMMMTDMTILDEMACSALSELANMISARTLMMPEFQELAIDISPPTLFQGKTVTLQSLRIDVIRLPFEFPKGCVDVFIAIEE